jgi:hypothetical protein
VKQGDEKPASFAIQGKWLSWHATWLCLHATCVID